MEALCRLLLPAAHVYYSLELNFIIEHKVKSVFTHDDALACTSRHLYFKIRFVFNQSPEQIFVLCEYDGSLLSPTGIIIYSWGLLLLSITNGPPEGELPPMSSADI